MKTSDLIAELQRRSAKMEFFAIGAVEPEAFDKRVIVPFVEGWEIYYTEGRGKDQRRWFATEEEACEHFHAWVTQLPYLFR